MPSHVLTLQCPDRPGIVASIAEGLFAAGANIADNAQFGDVPSAMFCMRTRFESAHERSEDLVAALAPRAAELGARMRIRREDFRPRMLVMVSREEHCLADLLQRWEAGELVADIAAIVSNHPAGEALAARHGIEFHHIAVTPSTKVDAELRLREVIARHDVELVVLARYMQILSTTLAGELAGRAINIHHSFLPGFKGARPYHQAWERGVKLIGATAHFVTGDLDEGPIIDQDVARVSHAVTAEQMAIVGRDIERLVLSRAVKAYVEGRVFLLGNRTVVFP